MMLMHRSLPQPFSRNTPRGGRMTAKMILQRSLRWRGSTVSPASPRQGESPGSAWGLGRVEAPT